MRSFCVESSAFVRWHSSMNRVAKICSRKQKLQKLRIHYKLNDWATCGNTFQISNFQIVCTNQQAISRVSQTYTQGQCTHSLAVTPTPSQTLPPHTSTHPPSASLVPFSIQRPSLVIYPHQVHLKQSSPPLFHLSLPETSVSSSLLTPPTTTAFLCKLFTHTIITHSLNQITHAALPPLIRIV